VARVSVCWRENVGAVGGVQGYNFHTAPAQVPHALYRTQFPLSTDMIVGVQTAPTRSDFHEAVVAMVIVPMNRTVEIVASVGFHPFFRPEWKV